MTKKLGADVSTFNADVNVAFSTIDAEAVVVITGVTEVNNIISAVDSVVADRAGAVTSAKTAVS